LIAFAVLPGCSTSLDLGYNDAGVPYDADCMPGTYAGGYSCTATSSSLFPGEGTLGDGSLSVTLVPSGAQLLALPSDASLSSGASGATSTSSLAGVLDCPTRQLTGIVGNVIFSSSTFTGTLSGSGVFTAVYDADASPPRLINGVLDPPPTLGAACTWSATLQ
jgi:hypothetical protein